MPASSAATSSRVSGWRRSTPETSPTNTGWIWRIESMAISQEAGAVAKYYPNDAPHATARGLGMLTGTKTSLGRSVLRLFRRALGERVLQKSVDARAQTVEVGARLDQVAGAALDRLGGEDRDRAGDLRGIFIRCDLCQLAGNQFAARDLARGRGAHALVGGFLARFRRLGGLRQTLNRSRLRAGRSRKAARAADRRSRRPRRRRA